MSNASVIRRIQELLDSYDARTTSPYEFEQAIEFHMDALERIDLTHIHRARQLTADIVRAHFYDADDEFGSPEDEQIAMQQLRQFIDGLPIN
jgi:hypothetical protein